MRTFLLALVALFSLSAHPQTAKPSAAESHKQAAPLKFGYLSYKAVFESMPDYAEARKQLDALRSQYEAETRRAEDEFNSKYEEFLEGQKDFPPTILQKRQSELQELMSRNIAFKDESRRLLKEAEKSIYAPLHSRLSAILREIGEERGYPFIINTDGNACPFINTALGDNVEPLVRARF